MDGKFNDVFTTVQWDGFGGKLSGDGEVESFVCATSTTLKYSQLSLRRTTLGPALSVRLREVSIL